MAEVLIADDERSAREAFRATLSSEGFSVRTARDGAEALAKFRERRPDIVLLDVMMPRMNGFVACSEMRAEDPDVPIVFLTAADSEADQVRGLGLGADDYVSKAAGSTLLLARIRRALARAERASSAARPRELALGAVRVDLDMRTVSDGGRSAALTASEADLLSLLASRRGEVVSADAIFSRLRGEGYVGDPAAIRMHVMNLRRKLGRAGDMVVNVPNAGYYLVK